VAARRPRARPSGEETLDDRYTLRANRYIDHCRYIVSASAPDTIHTHTHTHRYNSQHGVSLAQVPLPCFLVVDLRAAERSTILLLFLFNANNRTTKGIVNNNSVNVKAGEQQ
jgi:hypothetical protein